jgi:uncharacterized protein involved in cysteine biosynthesis
VQLLVVGVGIAPLAIPLLNLVFRPAIVIAATHVWARASDPAQAQIMPSNLA